MTLLVLAICLSALFVMLQPAVRSFEQRLRSDRRVRRLLRNRIWAPAAEAAIDFLLRGNDCPIQGWRKSATWAQVEMVHRELSAKWIK